jgi:hypothetical protein
VAEGERARSRVRIRAEWAEELPEGNAAGLLDVGSRVERLGREWVVVDRVLPRKHEDYRVELRELGLGPPHDPEEPR